MCPAPTAAEGGPASARRRGCGKAPSPGFRPKEPRLRSANSSSSASVRCCADPHTCVFTLGQRGKFGDPRPRICSVSQTIPTPRLGATSKESPRLFFYRSCTFYPQNIRRDLSCHRTHARVPTVHEIPHAFRCFIRILLLSPGWMHAGANGDTDEGDKSLQDTYVLVKDLGNGNCLEKQFTFPFGLDTVTCLSLS